MRSFKYACFYDKQFCEFAVRVAEKQDGYNATVLIDYQNGREEYFDISQNLCSSFLPNDDGGFEREGGTPNPADSYWGLKSRNDANYSIAIPFVSAVFPMEYMAGYLVIHDQADLSGRNSPSADFYRSCAKATGMLTYALVISVVLYVALAFGEARERREFGDDSVLRKFLYWFSPTIFSCYVAVGFGCVHFFLAVDAHVRISTPYFAKGALARQQTYALLVGSAIALPTLAYIAYGIAKVSAFANASVHIQPTSMNSSRLAQESSSPTDAAEHESHLQGEGQETASDQIPKPSPGEAEIQMKLNVYKSAVLTIAIAGFLSWPW